jgi:hypothetical protein
LEARVLGFVACILFLEEVSGRVREEDVRREMSRNEDQEGEEGEEGEGGEGRGGEERRERKRRKRRYLISSGGSF